MRSSITGLIQPNISLKYNPACNQSFDPASKPESNLVSYSASSYVSHQTSSPAYVYNSVSNPSPHLATDPVTYPNINPATY
jgi:hypothetical protein